MTHKTHHHYAAIRTVLALEAVAERGSLRITKTEGRDLWFATFWPSIAGENATVGDSLRDLAENLAELLKESAPVDREQDAEVIQDERGL